MQKVVTPIKNEAQFVYSLSKDFIRGPAPDWDPGSSGMTSHRLEKLFQQSLKTYRGHCEKQNCER